MKIIVFADELTVKYFRTMNMEGVIEDDPQQCLEQVKEILEEENSVILIGSSLTEEIREPLEELKAEHKKATIIKIPDAFKKEITKDRVGELLKQVLGVDI